jgi:hypothetical protein
MLPMFEILTLAKKGAGEVVREAGLQVMLLAMPEEIEALTGCRYQRFADRQAQRWSREHGALAGKEIIESAGRDRRSHWQKANFAVSKGYKEIPNLLTALLDHGMKAMKKGLASKAKTA